MVTTGQACLFAGAIDAGCTEIEALVLDASTEAEPLHSKDEYQYGE